MKTNQQTKSTHQLLIGRDLFHEVVTTICCCKIALEKCQPYLLDQYTHAMVNRIVLPKTCQLIDLLAVIHKKNRPWNWQNKFLVPNETDK